MAKLKYRGQSSGAPRVRRGALCYTDEEYAVIVMVAAVAGMTPGAWAQQAAYDAALRRHQGERHDREAVEALIRELREHRRVLTNIGGNLNDLARAANTTGDIDNQATVGTVLRLVRRVVQHSDTVLLQVRSRAA